MIDRCVIFTSKSCKDCFILSDNYQNLEALFPSIEFEYIDVVEEREIAMIHNVYTVPSLELYENQKLIAEFKHGNNKQYQHIVNFIRVHVELRKERNDSINLL